MQLNGIFILAELPDEETPEENERLTREGFRTLLTCRSPLLAAHHAPLVLEVERSHPFGSLLPLLRVVELEQHFRPLPLIK